MQKVCAGLVSLLLLTACEPDATDSAGSVNGANRPETAKTTTSPTVDAKWRGSMTITPAAASPRQRIALRFPESSFRGLRFSLAAWNGQGWELRYYLLSVTPASESYGLRGSGGPAPGWWRVEDDGGRGWPAIGISGPGPDFVMIPNTASPGAYRLCTANASSSEACALVTVGA
jgi:hypothetical protein